MSVVTKYTVRFFAVTSPYKVWRLGKSERTSTLPESVLRQGLPSSLFKSLFKECAVAAVINHEIPLMTVNDDTVFEMSFDTLDDQMLINIWVGSEKPKFEVLESKSVSIDGVVKGFAYKLEQGAYMRSDRLDLFYCLINHYIKSCTAIDMEKLVDGKTRLHLAFSFDFGYAYPSAVVMIDDKVSGCPEGYVECEMIRENLGVNIFVKRDKMLKRELITEADIKL